MLSRILSFSWCFVIVLFLTLVCISGVKAQTQSAIEIFKVDSPLSTDVAITQVLESGKLDGKKFTDKSGMKAFYEARNFEAAWLGSSFFSQRKADTLLSVFEESWRHGLNPHNYRVDEIRELMKTTKKEDQFKLDLVLSDALVRYGRDLTGMRVNPRNIGQNSKYWRQSLSGIDILDHVAQSSNTKQALASLEPQGNLYKKLQAELEKLYKLSASEGIPEQISVNRILRPGTSHSAILKIRERMGANPKGAIEGPHHYDDQLASTVMAFQKANGLKPDGIIGPQTLNLLNMTHQDQIDQILANLERLRWMEPVKPDRYVMVNVPSATLWAVENNQVKLEMPVVVGRTKRPTNIFNTKITGIRFNPRWTVPPTIKKEDYLPELQKDPYYLTDRGIELVDSENMTVDPGLIDWNQATWADVNAMRMVQGSGAANPLGLVRVIMPNPFNIYLHDTPTKSYFERSNRALSSGCVRMSDPQAVADFVLKTNEGWTEEKKNQILAKGRQMDIIAEHQMPVYIVYQTVWLGDNGQVVFGHDLYGHDRKLLTELKKIDGIAQPSHNTEIKTVETNYRS